MQVNIEVVNVKTVTITLTEEEYKLFRDGIGNTSDFSREEAGMSPKQSAFFHQLFGNIPSTPLY